MKPNTFILDVDIKQENYINEPVIKQNDSVVFIINLTDDGAPMDLTGVVDYSIATKRGDGVGVIGVGDKTGDSQVTFNLLREATMRTGRANHTVQLYSADERVSSFTFPMIVEKDPSASLIVTGGDRTLIEIVLGEGPKVIQDAKDATKTANNAAAELEVQGTYAKTQGDYAKAEGAKATESASKADVAADKANTAAVNADASTERADASADAADAAAEKANTSAENADESADRANIAANQANIAAAGLEEIKAATVAATDDAITAAELANTEAAELSEMKTAVTEATASAEGASTRATEQADYAKVQGDYAKAQGNAVQEIFDSGLISSVNGQTGAVVLTSEDIADSPTKRFVTDVKTAEWDGKETPEGAQAKVDELANTIGMPLGIASLGADGKVLASELPRIANTGNDVTITDEGNYFTGDTVEDALQELGASINQVRVSLITSTNELMKG